MNTSLKLPVYAKTALFLVGLYVLISILSIAQDIILPLLYAIIIAISIAPAVGFLVRKKINHTIAIAGVLTISILIISLLIVLLTSQISLLSDAWPQLTSKFQDLTNQTVTWASVYFNIDAENLNKWIANGTRELLNNRNAVIGITLTKMGGILVAAMLTPVYIFMILFYRPHLSESIHKIFGAGNDNNVSEILHETKTIIQSYLFGLFAEFIIVAILNSLGLLLLGIDYAILLGIIGALLNVIPYLGGIIGVALFSIIALVTKSPVYVLYVIGLYTLIQLIDNNYIVPKVVGSKVKINALICLIAVILGDALWGIPGMFLSIPLTAIIKVMFDRIHSLKPWGYLLGDTTPPLIKLNLKEIAKKLPSIISVRARQ